MFFIFLVIFLIIVLDLLVILNYPYLSQHKKGDATLKLKTIKVTEEAHKILSLHKGVFSCPSYSDTVKKMHENMTALSECVTELTNKK